MMIGCAAHCKLLSQRKTMLDPDAKSLLDLIASRNLPSYYTLPPAEARAFCLRRI